MAKEKVQRFAYKEVNNKNHEFEINSKMTLIDSLNSGDFIERIYNANMTICL